MRTLTKQQKDLIKKQYKWPTAYLIIDVVSKFGKQENTLEEDISDAITMYHNALRANWGEK